jgi:hypothetical protein
MEKKMIKVIIKENTKLGGLTKGNRSRQQAQEKEAAERQANFGNIPLLPNSETKDKIILALTKLYMEMMTETNMFSKLDKANPESAWDDFRKLVSSFLSRMPTFQAGR